MNAPIKLKDYERDLDARKAACGYTGNDFVAVNDGSARTPEKRALLRAIEQLARTAGRKLPFTGNS